MINLFIYAVLLSALWLRSAAGGFRVVSQTAAGVTLEYSPEGLAVQGADGELSVDLPGSDLALYPGEPVIPVVWGMVAVPPGSNPTVRVVQATPGKVWQGRLPVCTTSESREGMERHLHPQTEGIVGPATVRNWAGLRVVRFPIYPLRYNPGAPSVQVYEAVSVRVDFNLPTGKALNPESPAPRSRAAELVVPNAREARAWGRVRSSPLRSDDLSDRWPRGYLYRFETNQEGIYRLTFEQLRSGGVNQLRDGVPSGQVKLFGNGGGELPLDPTAPAKVGLDEIPIYVEDGGDGRFGPGDWLLFYGRGPGGWTPTVGGAWEYLINHYTLRNVYWFNLDPGGGGRRMEPVGMVPADTVSRSGICRYYLEDDRFIFGSATFIGTGREWYGYRLDGLAQLTFSPVLSAPEASLPARMRHRLVSAAASGGQVGLSVNGQRVSTFTPDAHTLDGVRTVTGLEPYLVDGANLVNFRQETATARLMFDWMEITYYSRLDRPKTFETVPYRGVVAYRFDSAGELWLFDVTDHSSVTYTRGNEIVIVQDGSLPHRIIAVTSAQFINYADRFTEYMPPPAEYSVANLWSSDNRCDLLMVVPDGYWEAAGELVRHYARREKPLRALAVRLSEIYNRFSGGLRDPAAIRNMLKFAQDHWADPPDYVLFCGDGDYNYRDLDRAANPDMVPPYEKNTICSDDWLVDFTTASSEGTIRPLPEMITGRLTAVSRYDLENQIRKIIQYEEEPEFGLWRNTLTLVADDEFGENYSSEDEHVVYTESLSANYIPATFDRNKIYLIEYPRKWGRTKPQAGDALVESINRGTLVVNYMGHGNPTLWAHEHVFDMSRDLSRIAPSRRQALFVAFTCDWAYWDDPSMQSFPERLMAMPDGGAIAVVASTRLTWAGSNNNLAKNFFYNLLSTDTISIGEALFGAKYQYQGSNSATYHLLGDPALRLGAPRYRGQFLTLTPYPLVPLALSRVSGEVWGEGGRANPGFSGRLEFVTLDTQIPRVYLIARTRQDGTVDYIPLRYNLPGAAIYRGMLSVTNGQFQGLFRVPKDVTLGGTAARVVAYYYNESVDGVFALDSVDIAGQAQVGADNDPPLINVGFDYRGYRETDQVGPDPLLILEISDSSGLNLTGAMGHGIFLTIDNGTPENLTPLFEYHLDSYQAGFLEKRLSLAPGRHHLEITAWDAFNNLAVKAVEVEVVSAAAGLIVEQVLNWPNPFKESTHLTFVVNRPAARYELLVFTVGGRLIWSYRGGETPGGMNTEAVWDGRDAAGRRVGNGVYLYKVKVWDHYGNPAEGLGKIVVAR